VAQTRLPMRLALGALSEARRPPQLMDLNARSHALETKRSPGPGVTRRLDEEAR